MLQRFRALSARARFPRAMAAKFGGFHAPHYPAGTKLAGDVLATSFWLFLLFMAKTYGPYQFGLRKPWEDHAPEEEFLKFHEARWTVPPKPLAPGEVVGNYQPIEPTEEANAVVAAKLAGER